MLPFGLCSVCSFDVIDSGQVKDQTIGVDGWRPHLGCNVGVGNHTPPAPLPDASWYPTADGDSGTNSAILVGQLAMSERSHLKSLMA